MTHDVARLLAEASEVMRSAGAAYAVIGGCARNNYAEPRATKDVDLVVAADVAQHDEIVRALATRGFRRATAVGDVSEPVPDLAVYRDASGRRIDLLFAHTAFERAALARATTGEPYDGVSVPVVSPEDLIVYKLVAGRTQDYADLEAVVRTLATGGRAIDWPYVEGWCETWDVRDRLARLRETLAEPSTTP